MIDAPATLPALATQGEQHMAIDMYYQRLGASAPIKSLAEEIADNTANAHEALKFGNASHMNALRRAVRARARAYDDLVQHQPADPQARPARARSTG